MIFFNKQSEIDKIRDEINDIIAHFEKCDTMINNRVTDLSLDVNTNNHNLTNQIRQEVSYIERRIDEINNNIKILANIEIGLIILVIIFICIVIHISGELWR